MNISSDTITVRTSGLDQQEWTISAEVYSTLRDFVTSTDFLSVTKLNPNKLSFLVNEKPAEDDLLLVAGDVITFETVHEKALITPRDAIKKLKHLVGLQFDCHGKKHDHWRTQDGRRVDFPRHARDLNIRTLKSIMNQAGVDMNLSNFLKT
jgi:predicted RNA binding protein YcfA (HicA-like mRNA interferase family)